MILDQNIMIGILALVALALVADIFHLRWKLRKMFRSKKGADMGETLIEIGSDIKNLESFKKEMELYLLDLEKRVRQSTKAPEVIRFNAFKGDGVGGNQSFATAFLSEEGDGVVLSSLYSRERVSIFSKPVKNFESDIELSEEERRAVGSAKAKFSHKKK